MRISSGTSSASYACFPAALEVFPKMMVWILEACYLACFCKSYCESCFHHVQCFHAYSFVYDLVKIQRLTAWSVQCVQLSVRNAGICAISSHLYLMYHLAILRSGEIRALNLLFINVHRPRGQNL